MEKERKCWWWFFHDWEFLREYGFTYQQLKCKKCGRLKITRQ